MEIKILKDPFIKKRAVEKAKKDDELTKKERQKDADDVHINIKNKK
jgi:hypothetical protein